MPRAPRQPFAFFVSPFSRGSLRARMIWLFVLFSIVPLAISNLVGYLESRRHQIEQAEHDLRNVAALEAAETYAFIRGRRDLVLSVLADNQHLFALLRRLAAAGPARDAEVSAALAAHVAAKLRESHAEGLTILLANGRIAASTEPDRLPGMDRSDSRCFRVGHERLTVVSTPAGDPNGIGVIAPIRDEAGSLLGVLCTRYALEGHRAVPASDHHGGATVLLIDPDGLVRWRSAPDEGGPTVAAIHELGALDAARAWSGRRAIGRRDVLVSYEPIPELGWGVAVIRPVRDVLAPLETLKWRALVLGGVLAAMILVAVTSAAGRLVRPIQELMRAATRTAAGARGELVPLRGPEELVELGRAFNQMSGALKESHEHLEQRIAERTRELQRSQAFVELLLDSIEQTVVVVDRDLNIVKTNHAAVRLFGDALTKTPCGPICGKPQGGCDDCLMRRIIATGKAATIERSQKIGTGQEILRVEAFPVTVADGSVEAVVEVGQIVTAERRVQAQMIHQEKMAAFGLLAAGVAHEIGNPLAAISAQLRMTRAVPEPERVTQTLAIVDREVERISRLLRDLVNFARRRRDEVSLVGPNQLVEDVARLLGHDPRARNVAIELTLNPAMRGIRAKEDHLVQVLLNLGINAIDAMPEGGRLGFAVAQEADEAVIRVEDSGTGIPAEAQARLFEPFFTTKAPGRGTGLGLFVSKGIVEGLGGRLVLARTGAGGTVFEVRLPVSPRGQTEPGS